MSDMPRDWTGTLEGVFRQLGASNHSQAEREENDYYATGPKAIDLLLTRESPSRRVWEPSSGGVIYRTVCGNSASMWCRATSWTAGRRTSRRTSCSARSPSTGISSRTRLTAWRPSSS